MKIDYVDNDKYIVYLNKSYYIFNKESINECLFKILKIIKKECKIDLYSTFNVECYINDNYGVILSIKKVNDPFLKYNEKINTNVKFYYKAKFLYEIEDYFIKNRVKCKIYLYKNKYYLELEDEYILICEYIKKIIFGEKVLSIINNS